MGNTPKVYQLRIIKKDIGARGGISLRAPIITQGWMSKNNVIIW